MAERIRWTRRVAKHSDWTDTRHLTGRMQLTVIVACCVVVSACGGEAPVSNATVTSSPTTEPTSAASIPSTSVPGVADGLSDTGPTTTTTPQVTAPDPGPPATSVGVLTGSWTFKEVDDPALQENLAAGWIEFEYYDKGIFYALRRGTCSDFVGVLVDDGSVLSLTDDTVELLLCEQDPDPGPVPVLASIEECLTRGCPYRLESRSLVLELESGAEVRLHDEAR